MWPLDFPPPQRAFFPFIANWPATEMLSEDRAWGQLPPGFEKSIDALGNRLVVRQDCRQFIDASTCMIAGSDQNQPVYRGRTSLKLVRFANGETALIRSYRHGGFFRRLTGDYFFTWPPRPFRELTITEELRRRGIRTVEVYGACVAPTCGPIYRGWLVTKELTDSQDLWLALRGDLIARAGVQPTLKAVAASLRALHGQGVYHSDLNLKNILVRLESDGVAAYVIDFDKARLFLGQLPAPLIQRNLDRLHRSIRKLDPERKYFSGSAWNDFLGYYNDARDG